MKILNFNLSNATMSISRQAAMKNLFVKDFLDIIMRDKNVYHVYELDNLYTPDFLDLLGQLAITHVQCIDIIENIMQNISNKEVKRISTPVSLHAQNLCNKMYKYMQSNNLKEINSIFLLHFPYPKVDKLMTQYFHDHPNTTLNYSEIMEELRPKCSTIDIRKFILLGSHLNADELFPQTNTISNPIYISSYMGLKETNKLPYILNILMNLCVWGIHILYENNYLKHFLFFNPYKDILQLNYRKNVAGCSKVDFFISVPMEKHDATAQEISQYIAARYN